MSLIATPWPDYRDFDSPLARDLCWLLSTSFDLPSPNSPYPPFAPPLTDDLLRWLRHLDTQGDERPSGDRPIRLGHYFEDLVAYYLRHAPTSNVSQLERNLPLRKALPGDKGVETIGELDFLFMQDGVTQHLEVAVKFYLGVDDHLGRHWPGPNSKDRLDLKWQRMLEHQLPMVKRFGYQNVVSRHWLKGILFEPWRSREGAVDNPQFDWLHVRDAAAYLEQNGGLWQWLQKSDWLGACRSGHTLLEPRQLLGRLQQHFTDEGYGVMLVNTATRREHRCFVVANRWPTYPLSMRPSFKI